MGSTPSLGRRENIHCLSLSLSATVPTGGWQTGSHYRTGTKAPPTPQQELHPNPPEDIQGQEAPLQSRNQPVFEANLQGPAHSGRTFWKILEQGVLAEAGPAEETAQSPFFPVVGWGALEGQRRGSRWQDCTQQGGGAPRSLTQVGSSTCACLTLWSLKLHH